MYRNILVPVDGSSFGEAALPLALNIARRAGAILHLVHVMPPMGTIYSEAPLYLDTSLEQELFDHQRASHHDYLTRLAHKLGGEAPVVIQTSLLSGDIPALIRSQAAAVEADLVVMTTHARGPLGRFWLGGVADDLVRKLPMPVLLVRPGEDATRFEPEPVLRHILIPLDGQPFAEQMIEPALELGKLMDADYTLVRVIKPVFPPSYPLEGASMREVAQSLIEQTQAIQAQLIREAHDYLDKIAADLRNRGFRVLARVEVEDKPALAILQEAQSADLVALCTHGRAGLSRLFLGSVADKVIRGGHLPVMVLRPVDVVK
jgi:nucleotide-binding universal stress UspA family protein